MTLHLRPVGRGNWHQVVWQIDSAHVPPMTVGVGDRFELGGVVFRVVRVLP